MYEQLVGVRARDVSAGDLVVGGHIPPVRTLAADLGLAAGTVAKAYREMETGGIVRPTAGHEARSSRRAVTTASPSAARAAATYLDVVAGRLTTRRGVRGAGGAGAEERRAVG
ncbi:GntR family transcriptional regulator [Kocuria rhizophila]|nr:GntR family transcriptional regulator [Kocuria rhizophila]